MADEPEDEELGQVEFVDPCVSLSDGDCWVSAPDALDPETECGAGVIAVQWSAERGLWYMTAANRKWVNAEQAAKRGKLSTIRAEKPTKSGD